MIIIIYIYNKLGEGAGGKEVSESGKDKKVPSALRFPFYFLLRFRFVRRVEEIT